MTRSGLAQFVFEIAVGHRIAVAAARGALMKLVDLAIGGRDIDGGGCGGEALVTLDRDLAAQRDDARIAHAKLVELFDAGFAGDQRGGDRVLHAHLRLAAR
jgi:hypothetical protein